MCSGLSFSLLLLDNVSFSVLKALLGVISWASFVEFISIGMTGI